MTTPLTRTQVGDSTDSREGTCRHLRQDRAPKCKKLRHRRQRGTQHSGSDEQVEFSAFFKPRRVRTGFGCPEKNLQPTDGWCEQYTHKCSTYRVAHHNHISSREHAWLKIKDGTSLSPENHSVPSVMSPSLPHLTTSTSSHSPISSTSPAFPTVPPSQTSPMTLNPHIPCDGQGKSGGSTQIPSLTDSKISYLAQRPRLRCNNKASLHPEDPEIRRGGQAHFS